MSLYPHLHFPTPDAAPPRRPNYMNTIFSKLLFVSKIVSYKNWGSVIRSRHLILIQISVQFCDQGQTISEVTNSRKLKSPLSGISDFHFGEDITTYSCVCCWHMLHYPPQITPCIGCHVKYHDIDQCITRVTPTIIVKLTAHTISHLYWGTHDMHRSVHVTMLVDDFLAPYVSEAPFINMN